MPLQYQCEEDVPTFLTRPHHLDKAPNYLLTPHHAKLTVFPFARLPEYIKQGEWDGIIPPRLKYGCLIPFSSTYSLAQTAGRKPSLPNETPDTAYDACLVYLVQKMRKETGLLVETRWVYYGSDGGILLSFGHNNNKRRPPRPAGLRRACNLLGLSEKDFGWFLDTDWWFWTTEDMWDAKSRTKFGLVQSVEAKGEVDKEAKEEVDKLEQR